MRSPWTRLQDRLTPAARPVVRALRSWRYGRQLRSGAAAGDYRYESGAWYPSAGPSVEVLLPAVGGGAVTAEQAHAWCRRQTLPELRAVGFDATGQVLWRVGYRAEIKKPEAQPATWFFAPSRLPDLAAAHLESSFVIAAAEAVDAVIIEDPRHRLPAELSAAAVIEMVLRRTALFSASAYRYDATTDSVSPRPENRPVGRLVKIVLADGVPHRDRTTFNRLRRGPYFSTESLPASLVIRLRDTSRPARPEVAAPGGRIPLLVTTSFLARGGAEHTLFETLKVLGPRFDATIVTLAPHRPELGDRRRDFHRITGRILCLGDLVHPDAMPGILSALLDSTGARILYNANSTTLFYDFAPRLKAERPELRVIDHLYDHKVGYIDRYEEDLRPVVDACVAENHHIREVLQGRGWEAERVPVIWPCGRPAEAFPTTPNGIRSQLRRDLGYARDHLVFLTAARMHPQKRPLDLVELAARVSDLEKVRFLIVGGGDLERAVDAAIADRPAAPIRRLPFRSDIPALIAAVDVGCLVSEYEGLPVFMLECLQAGRPFLGTDVGEMGAVLRSTGAGLVVERPGDLAGLEACVRRLADDGSRQALAARAREAGREFDVEACAQRYAEVFLGGPR